MGRKVIPTIANLDSNIMGYYLTLVFSIFMHNQDFEFGAREIVQLVGCVP